MLSVKFRKVSGKYIQASEIISEANEFGHQYAVYNGKNFPIPEKTVVRTEVVNNFLFAAICKLIGLGFMCKRPIHDKNEFFVCRLFEGQI